MEGRGNRDNAREPKSWAGWEERTGEEMAVKRGVRESEAGLKREKRGNDDWWREAEGRRN